MLFGSDLDGDSSKIFQISSSLLTKPTQMTTENLAHVEVYNVINLHINIMWGMLFMHIP